jgi:hypothetical protein
MSENNDLFQRLAERADRVEDQDSIDAIARAKEIIEQSTTKWTTEKPTRVGLYWVWDEECPDILPTIMLIRATSIRNMTLVAAEPGFKRTYDLSDFSHFSERLDRPQPPMAVKGPKE